MFDLFAASPSRLFRVINKKKYIDIDACDACRKEKKLCRYFCRYRNKKYEFLVHNRRKENEKMKKLKNILIESTNWFLCGLALGTGFIAALAFFAWAI